MYTCTLSKEREGAAEPNVSAAPRCTFSRVILRPISMTGPQMHEIVVPNRPAFKASEVCEIAQVQPYVLRSWENEFPELGVSRTPGGPRGYREAGGGAGAAPWVRPPASARGPDRPPPRPRRRRRTTKIARCFARR